MNAEEAITIVTRMPSVQILLALINVSALRDIPVMVFHVQVRLLETYIDLPIPGNGPDMANDRIVL